KPILACRSIHMSTRPAAVAGMFYPAESAVLGGTVDRLLAEVPAPAADAPPFKAVIVPHAGSICSGPIPAAASAPLRARAGDIRRVALLGPAHRVPFRGLAVPGVTPFDTPLGSIEIDAAAVAMLKHLPQITTSALAHEEEHSLEVQLPFLQ